MWYKIVGWLLIVLGTVSFAKPELLRNKLRKKGLRSVKRYLFAAAFSLGVLLMSAGWRHEGVFPKILMATGLVFIVKGVYLAKAKSADLFAARFEQLPPLYLRMFALVQIATGCVIILGLQE